MSSLPSRLQSPSAGTPLPRALKVGAAANAPFPSPQEHRDTAGRGAGRDHDKNSAVVHVPGHHRLRRGRDVGGGAGREAARGGRSSAKEEHQRETDDGGRRRRAGGAPTSQAAGYRSSSGGQNFRVPQQFRRRPAARGRSHGGAAGAARGDRARPGTARPLALLGWARTAASASSAAEFP